jgi:phage tail protein X
MIMAATYKTRTGDVLDDVVNRYYGRQDNGLVEFVLEANRGLADYGATLPAGLSITLPDAPTPEPTDRLQLFS